MLKFFSGFFTAIILTVFGLYGSFMYATNKGTQLDRCMALYTSKDAADVRNEPEVIEAMIEQGFQTYEELVESRCNTWIKNGQQF